jgi:hypothetical protein
VVQVGLDAVDVQALAEVEGRRQRRERKNGREPRGGQHCGVGGGEKERERADVVGVPCGSFSRDTRFAKSVSAAIKGTIREGEGWQRAFVGSWVQRTRVGGESTGKRAWAEAGHGRVVVISSAGMDGGWTVAVGRVAASCNLAWLYLDALATALQPPASRRCAEKTLAPTKQR